MYVLQTHAGMQAIRNTATGVIREKLKTFPRRWTTTVPWSVINPKQLCPSPQNLFSKRRLPFWMRFDVIRCAERQWNERGRRGGIIPCGGGRPSEGDGQISHRRRAYSAQLVKRGALFQLARRLQLGAREGGRRLLAIEAPSIPFCARLAALSLPPSLPSPSIRRRDRRRATFDDELMMMATNLGPSE